jgi:hypothetical protein
MKYSLAAFVLIALIHPGFAQTQNQSFVSCGINCGTSHLNCHNTCVTLPSVPANAPPQTQCQLNCSTQYLTCQQNCSLQTLPLPALAPAPQPAR